jgi:hypothetical protein
MLIAIEKCDVYGNHEAIKNIEINHHVGAIKDFMQDSTNVTKQNHIQKHHAFTVISLRSVRAIYRKRPSEAKPNEHSNFKYGHRDLL